MLKRLEEKAWNLGRRREEFAREQEGVKEWRGRNDGKPFALSTPDGRAVEKVKDMAEHVAAQMTRLLTQDRYSRSERTVLGDFNGVELVLAYDKWGDEKFRLAVPLLGVAREINYVGFIPDFSPAAMTAFKGKILEAVSPDYAKAYENSLADLDRHAKKMAADADRLQKDYEGMRGELAKLRSRQAELERTVTPLLTQRLKIGDKNNLPHVDSLSVGEVDFDSPEFDVRVPFEFNVFGPSGREYHKTLARSSAKAIQNVKYQYLFPEGMEKGHSLTYREKVILRQMDVQPISVNCARPKNAIINHRLQRKEEMVS